MAERVDSILEEMKSIATKSSGVIPHSDRIELQADYERQTLRLRRVGLRGHRRLSRRGNVFIETLVSPAALSIEDTRVYGDSVAEAQLLSQEAISAIWQAKRTNMLCFSGSFDRVPFEGEENNGQVDYDFVHDSASEEAIRAAQRVTLRSVGIMHQYATIAALAPMGILQRELWQNDILFFLGELELYGRRERVNLPEETARYLDTVVDPLFLAISDVQITGDTIVEAVEHSEDAADRLGRALGVLYSYLR